MSGVIGDYSARESRPCVGSICHIGALTGTGCPSDSRPCPLTVLAQRGVIAFPVSGSAAMGVEECADGIVLSLLRQHGWSDAAALRRVERIAARYAAKAMPQGEQFPSGRTGDGAAGMDPAAPNEAPDPVPLQSTQHHLGRGFGPGPF